MKKLVIKAIVIASIATSNLLAQPYNQNFVPNNPASIGNSLFHSQLASSEGFVIGSSLLSVLTGQENFSISRTSEGGLFVSNPQEWQNLYFTFGSSPCSGPVSQVQDCFGITAIQSINTAYTPTGEYMVAGSNKLGVFVSILDAVGVPLFTQLYTFPGGPQTTASRPIIVESALTPNTYFVAGSFGTNNLYVLHLTGSLGVINQTNRSFTTPIMINDMIESPHNSNEIVVVGKITNASTLQDGLFVAFDQTLGTVNNSSLIDDVIGTVSTDQYILSVRPMRGIGGIGQGYVIGGYSDWANQLNGTQAHTWFSKVNLPFYTSGGGSIIEGLTSSANTEACRVIERYNTSNNFEYYVLAKSQIGPVVYKLNAVGDAFSSTNPGAADEFMYANSDVQAFDMTLSSDLLRPDVGLHIVGTDAVTNAGANHFIESYFNGLMGCNATNVIANVYFPSSTPGPQPISANLTPFSTCSTFYITSAPFGGSSGVCGPFNAVPGGSNAKTTGLQNLENEITSPLFIASDRENTIVTFEPLAEDAILTISSIEGKTLSSFQVRSTDNSLSFSNDQLNSGIYFATLISRYSKQHCKFVISK